VPVLFQRDVVLPGLAKWQPYLFGFGMIGFTLFMMGAGTLASRGATGTSRSPTPCSIPVPGGGVSDAPV